MGSAGDRPDRAIGRKGKCEAPVPGTLHRGSNFGHRRVELAALAANFATDLRDGLSTYGLGGGTSDAGPVVAGVAGLLLAARPDLTGAEVKALLLASVTSLPGLTGKTVSGGAVNAHRALAMALRALRKRP